MTKKERKELNRMNQQVREGGLASVDLVRFKELRHKAYPRHRTTYLKRRKA